MPTTGAAHNWVNSRGSLLMGRPRARASWMTAAVGGTPGLAKSRSASSRSGGVSPRARRTSRPAMAARALPSAAAGLPSARVTRTPWGHR
jgi:hypothetical protein